MATSADNVTPAVADFRNGHITKRQIIKCGRFQFIIRETTAQIICRHHIFTGMNNATVLTVQVNQLCQRQPINRLGKMVGGIVVPDIPVIRAGSQYRFRFTERNDAHFFCFVAALIPGVISFFRHAAFFILQRDFGLFS
ncbi:hypothetical protein R9C16_002064 [Klebsiella aerogenes]|nr:hypothetical protein [Klebsiella aerogenes]